MKTWFTSLDSLSKILPSFMKMTANYSQLHTNVKLAREELLGEQSQHTSSKKPILWIDLSLHNTKTILKNKFDRYVEKWYILWLTIWVESHKKTLVRKTKKEKKCRYEVNYNFIKWKVTIWGIYARLGKIHSKTCSI